MSENIVELLAKLNSAFKRLNLYAPEHPMCISTLDNALETAQSVLEKEKSLTLGVSGATAVYKGQPIMKSQKRAEAFLSALGKAGVEWFRIGEGVRKEEILRWLLFLRDMSNFETPQNNPAWEGDAIRMEYSPQPDEPGDDRASMADLVDSLSFFFRSGTRLEIKTISGLAEAVASDFGEEELPLATLETALNRKEYLVRRGLLVMLVSIAIARKLGIGPEFLPDIGLSGLLCDTGLSSAEEGFLTSRQGGHGEERLWTEHPVKGAKMLAQSGVHAMAVVAAAEHHWGLKHASDTRHPASAIVGLSDDLVGRVIGGVGLPAHRLDLALIDLAKEGSHYQTGLVRMLIEMSGLFHPGTPVRLSNKKKGRIEQANSLDPLKPVVLLDDEGKCELLDLAVRGETITLAGVVQEQSR